MTVDLSVATAADLGRGIESGDIDARELCDAYLEAIRASGAAHLIYSGVTADRARSEADAARLRAKSGLRRGPLDGVPISWKDLFDVADTRTEAGSRLLAGRTPKRDAAAVANAARAGAVCLGKCHMSELAFSGLGLNPMTATPPNVFAADRVPGGSSSGSAASVAFSLAAASIGTDTGGSVRIPAAWNGLVGLKTSHGVVSLEGVVPLCPSIDTVGPLCRSVEDAALLFAMLSGTPVRAVAPVAPKRLRFLSLKPGSLGPTDQAAAAAHETDLETLRSAGISIDEAALDYVARAIGLSACIYTSEAHGLWRAAIGASPDSMFSQIRERFSAGAGFSGPDYVAALGQLRGFRRRYFADTAGYDAVLTPSVPNAAPEISRLTAEPEYYAEQNLLALRNSRIANLFDCCSVTLPNASPGCGLMLTAPPRQEARLLQFAHTIERMIIN